MHSRAANCVVHRLPMALQIQHRLFVHIGYSPLLDLTPKTRLDTNDDDAP